MRLLSWILAFLCLTNCCQTSLLAQETLHRFVTADSSKGRIAIIAEDGSTEWEFKIGPLHDLHMLPNGRLLFQKNWTEIVEVDPATNEVVWSYDTAKTDDRPVEVHAFQRLENGNTMIAESGRARIIEVTPSGEIAHMVALKVLEPHPHRDTRLARKLPNGNYLVCHEGDAVVREYDSQGSTVWEFEIPLFDEEPRSGHGPDAYGNQCFCAIRLENGNTLISTGNGHRVIEVTAAKDIVWQLEQRELKDITLAWVTTLQVLPNGNIVIGNCHAEEANPQVMEVSRAKEIVWSFRDFQRFGNSTTNTQILSVSGQPVVARPGVDR